MGPEALDPEENPVKGFVLMAVHNDGAISTHGSAQFQQCKDAIFTKTAQERIRKAQRSALLNNDAVNVKEEEHDVLFPSFLSIGKYKVECRSSGGLSSSSTGPKRKRQHQDQRLVDSSEDDNNALVPSTTRGPTEKIACAPEVRRQQSINIGDSAQVEKCLMNWLTGLQQLAVKRLAKIWIKHICPKKQATFPYYKKRRERDGEWFPSASIPGWWPPVEVCRFIEPDHIKRKERLALCLHLLRLRPSPEQLKKWNNGSVEPHETHITKGWTEFLMEVAPPSILIDMREPREKAQPRQTLLARLYELAKREEEFQKGDLDHSDIFWWHGDPAVPKRSPRRRRRSASVDNVADDSDGDDVERTLAMTKNIKTSNGASEALSKSASFAEWTPTASPSDTSSTDCAMEDYNTPADHHNVPSEVFPINPANISAPETVNSETFSDYTFRSSDPRSASHVQQDPYMNLFPKMQWSSNTSPTTTFTTLDDIGSQLAFPVSTHSSFSGCPGNDAFQVHHQDIHALQPASQQSGCQPVYAPSQIYNQPFPTASQPDLLPAQFVDLAYVEHFHHSAPSSFQSSSQPRHVAPDHAYPHPHQTNSAMCNFTNDGFQVKLEPGHGMLTHCFQPMHNHYGQSFA